MIIEVRTYRLRPAARPAFLSFFRSDVLPRMQQVGMEVVGAFASVTDPDTFAYIRTFPSLEVREQQYRAFYTSEDWLGWMIDHAIGHEESFEVFLGADEVDPAPLTLQPSGVHAARFTLSAAVGVVAALADDHVVVIDDEATTSRFTLDAHVQYNRASGRGMQAAAAATAADVTVGSKILLMAEAQPDGTAIARQIIIRAQGAG